MIQPYMDWIYPIIIAYDACGFVIVSCVLIHYIGKIFYSDFYHRSLQRMKSMSSKKMDIDVSKHEAGPSHSRVSVNIATQSNKKRAEAANDIHPLIKYSNLLLFVSYWFAQSFVTVSAFLRYLMDNGKHQNSAHVATDFGTVGSYVIGRVSLFGVLMARIYLTFKNSVYAYPETLYYWMIAIGLCVLLVFVCINVLPITPFIVFIILLALIAMEQSLNVTLITLFNRNLFQILLQNQHRRATVRSISPRGTPRPSGHNTPRGTPKGSPHTSSPRSSFRYPSHMQGNSNANVNTSVELTSQNLSPDKAHQTLHTAGHTLSQNSAELLSEELDRIPDEPTVFVVVEAEDSVDTHFIKLLVKYTLLSSVATVTTMLYEVCVAVTWKERQVTELVVLEWIAATCEHVLTVVSCLYMFLFAESLYKRKIGGCYYCERTCEYCCRSMLSFFS